MPEFLCPNIYRRLVRDLSEPDREREVETEEEEEEIEIVQVEEEESMMMPVPGGFVTPDPSGSDDDDQLSQRTIYVEDVQRPEGLDRPDPQLLDDGFVYFQDIDLLIDLEDEYLRDDEDAAEWYGGEEPGYDDSDLRRLIIEAEMEVEPDDGDMDALIENEAEYRRDSVLERYALFMHDLRCDEVDPELIDDEFPSDDIDALIQLEEELRREQQPFEEPMDSDLERLVEMAESSPSSSVE